MEQATKGSSHIVIIILVIVLLVGGLWYFTTTNDSSQGATTESGSGAVPESESLAGTEVRDAATSEAADAAMKKEEDAMMESHDDDVMKKDEAMMEDDGAMMEKDQDEVMEKKEAEVMEETEVEASESEAPQVQGAAVSTGSFTDYSADQLALADAGDVVLFFHAAWCPTCRGLEKNINANVVPDGVHILKVDYDSETTMKQKYGVTRQHTLVVVDSSGNKIKTITSPTNTLAQVVAAI